VLARWLLQHGSQVTLAANQTPVESKVSAMEVSAVLRRTRDSTLQEAVKSRRLVVLSTGCEGPYLDLMSVDTRLEEHARDAELVVLMGMDKCVLSGALPSLSCDVWKVRAASLRICGHSVLM
jgi:hypothetical protein